MKKIIIEDNCLACGVCFEMTNLIIENEDGTALPNGAGILPKDEEEAFHAIIDNCPVKAISLVDASLVRARGKEGIEELKKIVIEKMSNYKIEFPNSKDYEFNKAELSTPTAYGSGEYRYEYKSDDKAVQAGLREFDRVMYSQRKAIIQQLLIEYKNKKLRKYSYYEKEEGNFYYDVNRSIQKFLKQAVAEAKELSGNKISLPVNFDTFEVIPEMGINGDAINKELYVYQLRHIEELWFTQNIINELESLSWYDTYIDTDDMEDHRGKDVYCYKNISSVCSLFGKHILDEFSYVLNGYDGVKKIIEAPVNKFREQVEKEIKRKVDILINAINKYVLTKSKINVENENKEINKIKIKGNTAKQDLIEKFISICRNKINSDNNKSYGINVYNKEKHKNQEKEFNKDGYNKYGFKANGKSRWGTEYNDRGFKQNGYHNNGTRYDFKGYDIDGYDKNGLNRYGRNKNGFNKNRYHKNGTKYDDNGYDIDGFNVIGFNKNKYYRNGTKYDSKGYDIDGYDKNGFSINGFNKEGVNKKGFNKKGQHINGTSYDFDGYDMKGYDKNGFNRNGFKKDGYHMNGTKYDSEGYNMQGLDRYGFYKNGYDRNGYDKNGYNKNGIDKNGYDKNGYNKNGIDKNGYDKNGYNKNGIDRHGFKSNGKSRWGTDYNDRGFKKDGYHMNGTKYNKLGYDINGFDKFGNM